MAPMASTHENLYELIRSKIENLRPKLLDLTRRNPLVSTNLSLRSNSIIRVVDELPEILAYNLRHQRAMRFFPLPPLEDDPKDELQSKQFQESLASVRFTDELYLSSLEQLDPNDEQYIEKVRKIERDLKDRIRTSLGMSPRQKKSELSLEQHAKNNDISPSYDLPCIDDELEKERYHDNNIQTLWLSADLERKLNALMTKCNTWEQETGIKVLHAVFGFLEWEHIAGHERGFSPLLLLPVKLEKKRTLSGIEFLVNTDGDDPDSNFVIAEKMRIEFGIDFPKFKQNGTVENDIENYFQNISDTAPPQMVKWKVRRQVVFGVFPSARMAMYSDLDTSKNSFSNSKTIIDLLCGTGVYDISTPFAEEYDIDNPSFESKVPYLVYDADSSQFSTIIDVIDGKNIAVEGPPGTGKSQTIVNTIAVALAQGKKVLFVAEKMAALEVVRSRLVAVGLGEFLLPLQANRSARQQVIESIRERIEMASPAPSDEYKIKKQQFENTRSKLSKYIETISTTFENTGLTLYEILGKSITTKHILESAPRCVKSINIPDLNIQEICNLDKIKRDEITAAGKSFEKAWKQSSMAKNFWKNLSISDYNPYVLQNLLDLAREASDSFCILSENKKELEPFGINTSNELKKFIRYSEKIDELLLLPSEIDYSLVSDVLNNSKHELLKNFLENCEHLKSEMDSIKEITTDSLDNTTPSILRSIYKKCNSSKSKSLNIQNIYHDIEQIESLVKLKKELINTLNKFIEFYPQARNITFDALRKARNITKEFNRNIVLLRSAQTSDPSVEEIFSRILQTGMKIRSDKINLEEDISASTELSASELLSYSKCIQNSGLFSWFSSHYRTAKRTYLILTKRQKFEKMQMADDLKALALWKEEEQRFLEDQQAQALFGVHFNGINTDFSSFLMLNLFYQRVETCFSGVEYRSIKSLLKSGDAEILYSIPYIPYDESADTLTNLEQSVINLEQEITYKKELIEILENNLHLFIDLSYINIDTLNDIANRLDKILALKHSLDNNFDVKQIIANRFNGHKTRIEDFSFELDTLSILESFSEYSIFICDLMKQKQLGHVYSIINEIVKNISTSNDIIEELESKSGLPIKEYIANKNNDECSNLLNDMSQDKDGLYAHVSLRSALNEMQKFGFGFLVEVLKNEGHSFDNFDILLESIIFHTITKYAYKKYGEILSLFSTAKLDELRAELAYLDKEIISLSQQEVRSKVYKAANPPRGNNLGRKSEYTEMALIGHELEKKQRFMPTRALTQRAGRSLLELKPCWMMSPLAVAQYLPSGTLSFDLCILDEASQMPPENAIGALARCQQTMVVGDTNQLPPTSFFKKLIEDEDADEDEVVSDESILAMANSVFRPARRLRWHYRSRHSGLIQFSNHHMYNDDLVVFPSPSESRRGMGVSLVKVDGYYRSSINSIESSTIVKAALKFMHTDTDRSLGIVTLNQKQSELIREEMERAIDNDILATQYIEKWKEVNDGLESFFIKNLENVQGDERDVIFIGTVYGPEKPGLPVMQRFAGINGINGKRRMNVLFSRAKQQIVTFSSMNSSDIKADENTNSSAYMLKCWLEYAKTGVLQTGKTTTGEPDSDFEIFVMNQLRSMGCEPIPQVGVSGYRIDIGVKHSAWPHGYILGVECDGATYHSSRSARDRDRLREEVLTGLGWKLHRIWSTSWFNEPDKEIQRLRIVVDDRIKELKENESIIDLHQSIKKISKSINEDCSKNNNFSATTIGIKEDNIYYNSTSNNDDTVEIGDTVTIRYLTGEQSVREIILSDSQSHPENGVINIDSPLGRSLIDAEIDEEIEFIAGHTVRKAKVESIIKHKNNLISNNNININSKSNIIQSNKNNFDGQEKQISKNENTQGYQPKHPLNPSQFYEISYISILQPFTISLIDKLGPITFHNLSEIIARAHNFQRTGSQIRKQVWNAISNTRESSKTPDGHTVFWPANMSPTPTLHFRGLVVNGEKRSWQDVPYPEKLGLAKYVLDKSPSNSKAIAEFMASKIGFIRLKQATRVELITLLEEAKKICS